MGRNNKTDHEWAQARRRCGLSDEDVRMARELGFKPRSLIKNIPGKSQPWKAPVREWIRELHARRFGGGHGPAAGPGERERDLPPAVDFSDTDSGGLIPQYDTQTDEVYFTRASDGVAISMEEAGRYFAALEQQPVGKPPAGVHAGNVRALGEAAWEENCDLRHHLKHQMNNRLVDKLVWKHTDRIGADFDCTTCANCCKELHVGLTQADVQRLAGRLALSEEELCRKYLEPATDAKDAADEDQEATRWRTGRPCPFLKDNCCTVYEDRPEQCRKYPYLHAPDFVFRTLAMLDRTCLCPIVYRLFEELRKEMACRRGGRR
jgi:uncharacterized protein